MPRRKHSECALCGSDLSLQVFLDCREKIYICNKCKQEQQREKENGK